LPRRSALSSCDKVTVLEVKGARVTVGYEINTDVPFHGSETWEHLDGVVRSVDLTASPEASVT
jgi:hypothetical protein